MRMRPSVSSGAATSSLVALATALLLCGCRAGEGGWSPPPPAPTDGPPAAPAAEVAPGGKPAEGPSRIVGWKVHEDAPDHMVLDIEYVYDGTHGYSFVSVNALQGGYGVRYLVRPELVYKGRHEARVWLGANDSAPETFRSDQLQFEMYPGGGRSFTDLLVPFPKEWRVTRPAATATPAADGG